MLGWRESRPVVRARARKNDAAADSQSRLAELLPPEADGRRRRERRARQGERGYQGPQILLVPPLAGQSEAARPLRAASPRAEAPLRPGQSSRPTRHDRSALLAC